MENYFSNLLSSYIKRGESWQKKLERRYYLPVASDTVFLAFRDGLAYVILIHSAITGRITLTQFSFMLGAIARFSTWMFGTVNCIVPLITASDRVSDFRAVIDMEDTFKHDGGITLGDTTCDACDIIFRDVSFKYEQEGKEILSHINLHIKSGEKIALVGNNGAGKTTFVKLLCGFYHPSSGEILVNGISVEDYNIDEYFKLIGAVFQDAEDMNYTISETVSGGHADPERFWHAVSDAGLSEKIKSLENGADTGLSTIFDEHGIRLSGGETQKLMLARCIYKNAPIMILDEPASALDPIAESRMYREYNSLCAGKTGIFISHRLAGTRFCDRILFLENGKIAEQGTHEELMSANGRYAKVYDIQSHYYKEDGKNAAEMEAAYE